MFPPFSAHRAGRRLRLDFEDQIIRDTCVTYARRGTQIMTDFGSMVFVFVLATFIGSA